MLTPEQNVAEAVRVVAIRMEEAIERGKRSKRIDATDLLETLLSVADYLDPPISDQEAPLEDTP